MRTPTFGTRSSQSSARTAQTVRNLRRRRAVPEGNTFLGRSEFIPRDPGDVALCSRTSRVADLIFRVPSRRFADVLGSKWICGRCAGLRGLRGGRDGEDGELCFFY